LNNILGLLVIPAGGLGTFSGGFIAKRFRLNRSQVIKMYIYSQMVTIPLGLGFLFYCPQVDFSGITKFQIEGCIPLFRIFFNLLLHKSLYLTRK
jgi:hypothetical protein